MSSGHSQKEITSYRYVKSTRNDSCVNISSEGMSTQPKRKGSLAQKAAIAAIDFGTTCTGYAYYLRKDTGSHIHDINIDQAWTGSAELGLQAPTTVLMQPDKTFHSFGFEAEAKYKSLTLKNEHATWHYFRYFKMKLHHEKELNRDMMLQDADGKKMRAILIFTEAIKYVKKHLLTKMKDALRDEISLRDIQWVITVPAIWRDSAKQFMRESASRAGVPNDQLLLALEPESAAIFCKELALTRSEGVEGVFLRAFDPGEKYLVLDLGGGTVDTTGHQVLEDGSLKELHAATGGPWGGQLVNEAFERFIEKLVTPDVFRKFCKHCTSDWIEFQRDFEKKKRSFSPATEEVDLNFPVDLDRIYRDDTSRDLKDTVEGSEFRRNVELVKHSMILKPAIMKSFFGNATKEIIKHIESLLKKKEMRSVSSILLVGGFSESIVVSSTVRDHFSNLRVIAPGTAGSAILKGAVMFGYDQRVISSRISPYTYGVHTRKLFDKTRHPENRKKVVKGIAFVNNAFDKHIEKSEDVFVGGTTRERKYVISNRKNPSVFWNVYQSENKHPVFCDEEGCMYLGRLQINIPEEIKDQTVSLTLSMTCKGTELEAIAVSIDHNLQCATKFEFLAADYTTGSEDIKTIE